MSPRLGTLNYANEEGTLKSYSSKTGRMIDEEVKRFIDECYFKCKEMLSTKKHLVEK